MKRKMLVVLLSLAMLLTLTPMTAFAADGLQADDLVIEKTGIQCTGVYNRSGYGVISFYGPYAAGEDGDDWPWYGLVGSDGNYVIPAKPCEEYVTHDTFGNTFFVSDGIICDYKKGFYDLEGNEAFDLDLYETTLGEDAWISSVVAMPFYDGKAIYQVTYEEEWNSGMSGGFNYDKSPYYVIDKNGRVLEEYESYPGKYYGGAGFTLTTNFSDQAVYYDYEGKTVIDLKDRGYSGFTGAFFGGYAWVRNAETNLYGFIDETGAEVIPCEYTNVGVFIDGLVSVQSDGLYGCINADNELVIPIEYDDAFAFGEGLVAVKVDGKYGLIDYDQNVVVPFEWDDISSFAGGSGYAIKDGYLYTINKAGGSGDDPVTGGHWDETHTHYYFDNGEMAKGWQDIDDEAGESQRYYFDEEDGTVNTGLFEVTETWIDQDGNEKSVTETYYADSTGALQTGWQEIDGYRYYFDTHGAYWMYHGGLKTIYETLYYFGEDGKLQTGWIEDVIEIVDDDGTTVTYTYVYYGEPDGVIATGWKTIDGNTYYFEPINKAGWGGYMNTGLTWVDKKAYYLDEESGILQTGWIDRTVTWEDEETGETQSKDVRCYGDPAANGQLATGWKKIDGDWYFFDDDFAMVSKNWKKDSKGWCYLGEDGKMVTNDWAPDSKGMCWIGSNGYMVEKTQWIQVDGGWYYIEKGYRVQNSWRKDSKGWCYLGPDGLMVTNDWVKDSKGYCWIGSAGYMVEKTQWFKIGDDWYHITKGYRDQGKWMKDSKGWCYLDSEGKMVTNGWAKDSKGYCWIGSAGYMVEKSQWIQYEGGWYYINKGYRVQNKWMKDSKGWCWLGEDGKMLTNGFAPDSHGQCWIGPDGYMEEETKLVEYNGATYGIRDGYMIVNGSLEIDGTVYWFDENGKLYTIGL